LRKNKLLTYIQAGKAMKKIKSFLFIFLCLGLAANISIAGSQTEEAARLELKEIQERIDRYDLDWEAGLTSRLLDYTREERSYGFNPPDNYDEIVKQRKVIYPSTWFRDLPEQFNWVDSNKITPVRNQGGCGSCWIFAATAALEGTHWVYRHEALDISEQAVLSCFSAGWGCGGGWPEAVYEWYRDETAFLETCMPYQANDQIPCATEECPTVSQINTWFYIANNVDDIKAAVLQAPIAVCFDVYSDFNGYFGGCYSHYDDGSSPEAGHCVLITGWDDNICPGGAWRAKNSWGPFWGDDGYFWIKYENNCNFGREAMLLSVSFVEIATQSPLPEANLCDEYSLELSATGGNPPYTWSYAGGIYPDGLSLDPEGILHGQPTKSKQYWFNLKAEDASMPPAMDFLWAGLYVADAVCYSCGDCNTDDLINILDIVFLINFIYKDGPAPNPLELGRIDGDELINILDVVYLINYIYKDGPAPVG